MAFREWYYYGASFRNGSRWKTAARNQLSAKSRKEYSEIEIGGSKIDFYDAKNKVIHEIKRSDKMEAAHAWQVKYYILLLEQNGVEGVTGILEYPKLRETKTISLMEADRVYVSQVINQIEEIAESDKCPPLLHAKICKSCSYYDFCYCTE